MKQYLAKNQHNGYFENMYREKKLEIKGWEG